VRRRYQTSPAAAKTASTAIAATTTPVEPPPDEPSDSYATLTGTGSAPGLGSGAAALGSAPGVAALAPPLAGVAADPPPAGADAFPPPVAGDCVGVSAPDAVPEAGDAGATLWPPPVDGGADPLGCDGLVAPALEFSPPGAPDRASSPRLRVGARGTAASGKGRRSTASRTWAVTQIGVWSLDAE
jgi:hypothetical protein